MDDITIRRVNMGDASRLLDIYSYYVTDTAISWECEVPCLSDFSERIAAITKRYPYLVAESGGTIIGYAYAHEFVGRKAYEPSAELTIYLDKNLTGRGAGRKLYEQLMDELLPMGVVNCYACIGVPCGAADEYVSDNSLRFHERLGFRAVGTFRRCGRKFGRWYDMVWAERNIADHKDNAAPFVPYPDTLREAKVSVNILRIVDDISYPFIMEAELIDSSGKAHRFFEESTYFCREDVTPPAEGLIRCRIVGESENTYTIDTFLPDYLESMSGDHRFEVGKKSLILHGEQSSQWIEIKSENDIEHLNRLYDYFQDAVICSMQYVSGDSVDSSLEAHLMQKNDLKVVFERLDRDPFSVELWFTNTKRISFVFSNPDDKRLSDILYAKLCKNDNSIFWTVWEEFDPCNEEHIAGTTLIESKGLKWRILK